ncbi:RNA-binding protein hfq [Dolichospermum sp. FACHB-1091]|uniref:Hfq-related RNA-binding protein n=1 Tax=Dolichospermum sp. FACHB-1091 TaxID=2692798 RepID=UPI0016817FC7|nr:RNA-binding protein hfq [Dolichospermum sp. FACHB-1091]MBD2442827.1 RNA-binding protein hfq [Dolichospermum sp. FACHB-1091]
MTINQFDTSLPSIRQVQKWIREKVKVEFKLITDDLITGRVFWQDHNCICILNDNNENITLWRQAIAYMKPLIDE